MKRTGLLLIDMQNDYFANGNYELIDAEAAARQAQKVLARFRSKGWPIFHVQHISLKKDAAFFAANTYGSDFYKIVYPKPSEIKIMKHTPDSFFQTNLQEALQQNGITQLVICGMMTHMCVDTTVRAARNFGYAVTLIADACATRNLQWHDCLLPANLVQQTFLAALSESFATVKTADEWLFEQQGE